MEGDLPSSLPWPCRCHEEGIGGKSLRSRRRIRLLASSSVALLGLVPFFFRNIPVQPPTNGILVAGKAKVPPPTFLQRRRLQEIEIQEGMANETIGDEAIRDGGGEDAIASGDEEGGVAAVSSLFPLSARDVFGLFLACLGLVVAAGGGIGGGGILVPLYILILRFPPKHAIPLSNVTVFGGAVANLLLNIDKRHPAADRPLIDWDLILVMEPLTLSGALIGTNLNKFLPDVVIVLALVLVLGWTAQKTLKKALQMYRKETQGWNRLEQSDQNGDDDEIRSLETMPVLTEAGDAIAATNKAMIASPIVGAGDRPSRLTRHASLTMTPGRQKDAIVSAVQMQGSAKKRLSIQFERLRSRRVEEDDDDTLDSLELAVSPAPSSLQEIGAVSNMKIDDDGRLDSFRLSTSVGLVGSAIAGDGNAVALQRILELERRPRTAIVLTMACMFLFVLLMNVLKGGGGFPSPLGIVCGSVAFWFSEFLIVVATCVVCLRARSYLLKQTRQKEIVGYKYLDTDIRWNPRSTVVYPALCMFAGVVAGLFGVGGGLVKAPLMLALGVHPAVASATSATMILFTTFTATTSFLVFGQVVLDYAALCLSIGFGATLAGQTIMNTLLKKTNHLSYIAFSIAIVVILSCLCMTAEWVFSVTTGNFHHRHEKFCSTSSDLQ